jgi:hypothetical protein
MKHLLIALIAFLILVASAAGARAQTPDAASSAAQPYYVGTSVFMVMNLASDDEPPHFFQMNVGYQLTPQDRLSVQAITWRYYHPLGVPYGGRDSDSAYPGHVRELGVGLEYQRALPKRFFASASAIPFLRRYYNTQNEKIGHGMQLYLTGRFGYRVGMGNRLFLEPSIAFNYWPISTNVPDAFAAQDERFHSYFLFEPGINMGFRF